MRELKGIFKMFGCGIEAMEPMHVHALLHDVCPLGGKPCGLSRTYDAAHCGESKETCLMITWIVELCKEDGA